MSDYNTFDTVSGTSLFVARTNCRQIVCFGCDFYIHGCLPSCPSYESLCTVLNPLVPLKNDNSRWIWRYSLSESKIWLCFLVFVSLPCSFSHILVLLDKRTSSMMSSWLLVYSFFKQKARCPRFQCTTGKFIPSARILKNLLPWWWQ